MAKYKVLKDFKDGQSKVSHKVGSEIELTQKRATEIADFSKTAYIKEVKETKKDKK